MVKIIVIIILTTIIIKINKNRVKVDNKINGTKKTQHTYKNRLNKTAYQE